MLEHGGKDQSVIYLAIDVIFLKLNLQPIDFLQCIQESNVHFLAKLLLLLIQHSLILDDGLVNLLFGGLCKFVELLFALMLAHGGRVSSGQLFEGFEHGLLVVHPCSVFKLNAITTLASALPII